MSWFNRKKPEVKKPEPPEPFDDPIGPVDLRGWRVEDLKPTEAPMTWSFLLSHVEMPGTYYNVLTIRYVADLYTHKSYSVKAHSTIEDARQWPKSTSSSYVLAGLEVRAEDAERAMTWAVSLICEPKIIQRLELCKRQLQTRAEDDKTFEALKAANPEPISFDVV